MIVLAELPFAFVENQGFQYFCSRAVPLFNIPSRATITRDVVKLYVKEKMSLKSLLAKNNQRYSLTTDLWTAPTTSISYMVVTCHFIDENWCLQRKIISFEPVTDHKADTIADRLKNCMLEWGIEKIFTITVDNATTNDNAIKIFKKELLKSRDDALVLGGEFLHVRCCAHILNLIAKDGLKKIKGSVAAIRNTLKYCRSSNSRFKSFERRVNKKVSRGSLVLDVPTRWNSTFLMLFASLKFRSTFQALADEDRPYHTYFLEEENGKKREWPPSLVDWDQASRLVRFLDLFYESTLAFSAFKTMT